MQGIGIIALFQTKKNQLNMKKIFSKKIINLLPNKLTFKLNLYYNPIRSICAGLIVISIHTSVFLVSGQELINQKLVNPNDLPFVLAENHNDLINYRLKLEAAQFFTRNQLPETKEEWELYRIRLKNKIVRKTGIVVNHDLPLKMEETGVIQMNGYSIKNIMFQTRPGIYATANLYIPDGNGLFPGAIVMMGHSILGRMYPMYQSVGHSLASNGYICLCIDPWGAGERTTIHGQFEDHGDENSLGSSLMNIGETLMGIQISDNIRGVDLLCSLPNIDTTKIGATGSSGGGNQTMWLAAMDERIKAAVPVVSAGTFESYIMGSPCICEVLPDGLTFTEEAGILSLVAPRAIKMCNHKRDDNPAFYPSEMIRSYKNAKSIFEMYGTVDNISYQVSDTTHGYKTKDIEIMLGWFDLHLNKVGDGSPKQEASDLYFPKEKLMVFPSGERDSKVISTEKYCQLKGTELRTHLLNSKSFDSAKKKNELRDILGVNSKSGIKMTHEFSGINGWNRLAIETSDNKLIPVLLSIPNGISKEFVIVCNTEGKRNIPVDLLNKIISSGKGIALVDLSGTGEVTSTTSSFDIKGNLRTMSRSLLWFGKITLGEWVKELELVADVLRSEFDAKKIQIDGTKEAGLAALFLAALDSNIDHIVLRTAPVSYLFDTRESIDFFGMGIHLPGFLKWGDISLVAALSGNKITFINPVSMSGKKLSKNQLEKYQAEFEKLKVISKQSGRTIFVKSDK